MPRRRQPKVITDEVELQDRLWFKQNPRVRERIRPPYPREIEAYGDTPVCVHKDPDWGVIRYPLISGLKVD
ncbi:hypothetical protein BDD21_4603 [Thiocapsa rosea]|uniref:Uncharacterized protein n=1 Tax=Thiocapsa rosea TaxID=69360 RepID=A0A495VCH9_9GAMM|nr:hypothetical protein BDD21_4603 [Thiocapsa rosea]